MNIPVFVETEAVLVILIPVDEVDEIFADVVCELFKHSLCLFFC